nr:MAG TPA: hypothetical protein [Caudoviricetes sp.]
MSLQVNQFFREKNILALGNGIAVLIYELAVTLEESIQHPRIIPVDFHIIRIKTNQLLQHTPIHADVGVGIPCRFPVHFHHVPEVMGINPRIRYSVQHRGKRCICVVRCIELRTIHAPPDLGQVSCQQLNARGEYKIPVRSDFDNAAGAYITNDWTVTSITRRPVCAAPPIRLYLLKHRHLLLNKSHGYSIILRLWLFFRFRFFSGLWFFRFFRRNRSRRRFFWLGFSLRFLFHQCFRRRDNHLTHVDSSRHAIRTLLFNDLDVVKIFFRFIPGHPDVSDFHLFDNGRIRAVLLDGHVHGIVHSPKRRSFRFEFMTIPDGNSPGIMNHQNPMGLHLDMVTGQSNHSSRRTCHDFNLCIDFMLALIDCVHHIQSRQCRTAWGINDKSNIVIHIFDGTYNVIEVVDASANIYRFHVLILSIHLELGQHGSRRITHIVSTAVGAFPAVITRGNVHCKHPQVRFSLKCRRRCIDIVVIIYRITEIVITGSDKRLNQVIIIGVWNPEIALHLVYSNHSFTPISAAQSSTSSSPVGPRRESSIYGAINPVIIASTGSMRILLSARSVNFSRL